MQLLKKWLFFISNFRIPYLGISLFLSILIIRDKLLYSKITVTNFDSLLPSVATFENIEISKRLNLFYGSFFIVFSGILLISFIILALRIKWNILKKPLKTINQLSFFSVLFILFELIEIPQVGGLQLINGLILCVTFYYTFIYITHSKINQASQSMLLWIGALAFSFSFLFREIAFWIGVQNISFIFVFVLLFAIITTLIISANDVFNLNIKGIFNTSLPLFLLPLLSVFSDEFYLILNQRNIHIFSPNIFYLIQFTLLIILTFIWFVKKKGINYSMEKTLNNYILPVQLSVLFVFQFYQPFIDQPKEMYELANSANGMMRLFEYGQVPILEAFSSHVLSDFGLMPLYSMLNGYDGSLSFLVYGGITDIFFWMIFYFFLQRILKNGVIALSIILLVPFIQYYYMSSYFIIFITGYLFSKLYQNNSFKTMLYLEFVVLFACVWKIELGLSIIIITSILLLSYLISNRFSKKIVLEVVKSIVLVFSFCMTVLIILIIFTDIDILSNIRQALNYLGANQAHGLSIITLNHDRIFYTHYFIFPLISVLLLIYYLVRLNSKREKNELFFEISMVSMLIFYVVNIQRGLVRHSFAETNESFISSFFYLILILFIWDIIKQNRRALIFIPIIMTLIVFVFKKGEDKDSICNFSQFEVKYRINDTLIKADHRLERVKGSVEFSEQNYAQLKSFLDNNFDKKATFIDFSNTPMLYFYTGRNVPSYFNQYMTNTPTEWLQEENLRLINKMDIPVVVYSNEPENWFDNTDGVPNTIRYALISEYIYQNYIPYQIINNHQIWIKKSIRSNFETPLDSNLTKPKIYSLKQYPQLLSKTMTQKRLSNLTHATPMSSGFEITPIPINQRYRNFIKVTLPKQLESQELHLQFSKDSTMLGSFSFSTKISENEESYYFPLSTHYNWIIHDCNRLSIITKEYKPITNAKIHLYKQFQ